MSLDLILCLIPTYLQAIAQGLRTPYVVIVNVLPAPPDSPATLQLVAAATLRDATALPATVVAPITAVFGYVRPVSSPEEVLHLEGMQLMIIVAYVSRSAEVNCQPLCMMPHRVLEYPFVCELHVA